MIIPTYRIHLLADYLAATRNEIAVDEMLLRTAHATTTELGYLPRVPNWVNRALKAPGLTRIIWRICRVLWLAGGAIAYFAFDFLKLEMLRQTAGNSSSIMVSLKHGALLAFTSRVYDVFDPDQNLWLPSVWLTCPWVPQDSLPRGVFELPLMSVVTRADLREAFVAAVNATYVLARDPLQTNWALQSYTALRWFMVRRAIDRIPGTLVIANHFDRWAVLVDRSIRAGKLRGGGSRRLVLVQHGTLGDLGKALYTVDTLKPLPTKLSCVDELHAYNAIEEAAFRRSVLTEMRYRAPMSVHFFKPRITLIGELSTARIRLLFVGHPICESFQVKLFQELRKGMDFEVFYKPHPKAPMSDAMVGVGWTIIDNPKTFPRVDLLVSYPSTLVLEYQGAGIAASIHSLGIPVVDLPQFLDQTLLMIKAATNKSSRSTG